MNKISIEIYKQKLKGLPKDEKIAVIQQELNNRALSIITKSTTDVLLQHNESPAKSKSPTNVQLETLKKEIENNLEAYESTTNRKELIPFMYDRDLNWYFNAKNIAAQSNLVMPSYDYFNEGPGKGVFEPIDFFNLLEKQYQELQQNLDRPFDFLNYLKSIPLSEREQHTLFGFILKWYGGYPINNTNEQYNNTKTT
jgi:hypothetical protein